jgi:hypothetical protein
MGLVSVDTLLLEAVAKKFTGSAEGISHCEKLNEDAHRKQKASVAFGGVL